jgi:nucleotide-binding universal stress UspA family protein
VGLVKAFDHLDRRGNQRNEGLPIQDARGKPHSEIIRYAKENTIDLIVMVVMA